MSSLRRRCLVLIALLAAASSLQAAIAGGQTVGASAWPVGDTPYQVEGWTMGPATVESAHGVSFISRTYQRQMGGVAYLVIATSPEAKRVYRTGADVPFLGSGYTTDPAPPSLVPPAPGREARVLRREGEAAILLYAYGERRGLLGNGLLAWGAAALDAARGVPNDYYLLRLLVPLADLDTQAVHDAVALADRLFPRLAAWYAP